MSCPVPNLSCQTSAVALDRAIKILSKSSGEPIPETQLRVVRGTSFWAMAELRNGCQIVHVCDGSAAAIQRFWDDALQSSVLGDATDGSFRRSSEIDAYSLSALSMTWLMLHELMHFHLGHLSESERAALIGRSRASRGSGRLASARNLEDIADPRILRHCFELQCDSDAFTLLLTEVEPTDTPELRRRIAAVVAVLARIETENSDWGTLEDHPSSGARFFTLLGQVFQYWLLAEADVVDEDGTSRLKPQRAVEADEIKLFMSSLVVPVVNDAVDICVTADAKRFLSDMADQGALFQDIFTAQYGELDQPSALMTEAAREWLRLYLINEQIIRRTGQRPGVLRET